MLSFTRTVERILHGLSLRLSLRPLRRRLVSPIEGLFAKTNGDLPTLTLVDVGFRGGVLPEWEALAAHTHTIAFEPAADEYERLRKKFAAEGGRFSIYPYAIGKRVGTESLAITKLPFSSGIKPGDSAFLERMCESVRENLRVIGHCPVDVVSLDSISEKVGLHAANFLKIDTEGTEAEILEGAAGLLRSPNLFGVKTEVWFGEIKGNPSEFSSIDCQLRDAHFHLFDLTTCKYPRRTFEQGKLVIGPMRLPWKLNPFGMGQMLTGDALFLKDPIHSVTHGHGDDVFAWNDKTVLAMAGIYCIYGLLDCAVELLSFYSDNWRTTSAIDFERTLESLSPVSEFSYRSHGRVTEAMRMEAMAGYMKFWKK